MERGNYAASGVSSLSVIDERNGRKPLKMGFNNRI